MESIKCPICLDFMLAAYQTLCGHSFCHACIIRHLKFNASCPLCKASAREADLQPNQALERIVKRLRRCESEGDKFDEESDAADDREMNSVALFLQQLLCKEQERLEKSMQLISALKTDLDRLDASVPVTKTSWENEHILADLYYQKRVVENDQPRFTSLFAKLSCKHTLRMLNSVCFGDMLAPSNVVSSVEYSPARRAFAVSGSSKQIRIYDYDAFKSPMPIFGSSRVTIPSAQISTSCKIAALSWHPSGLDYISAADYEGSIKVYNVDTSAVACHFDEHERRVWSIDYCPRSPDILISGSDDGRVKIWSSGTPRHSLHTIDIRANVCSVQFHPDGHKFACGAADHCVYIYDHRSAVRPLATLKEHKKAVSYVKWLDPATLISASTDNTIKQWSIADGHVAMTHRGHLHEKNFVGLSVCQGSGLFACGSETNKVCIYSQYSESPISEYSLGGRDPVTGQSIDVEGFASSVSWVDETELLAGNSLGMVSALAMRSGEC